MRTALLATALLLSAAPLAAQNPPANFTRAVPTPKQDTIPAARDIPFPGTIRLAVDGAACHLFDGAGQALPALKRNPLAA